MYAPMISSNVAKLVVESVSVDIGTSFLTPQVTAAFSRVVEWRSVVEEMPISCYSPRLRLSSWCKYACIELSEGGTRSVVNL
jgi:hypothetical protein